MMLIKRCAFPAILLALLNKGSAGPTISYDDNSDNIPGDTERSRAT